MPENNIHTSKQKPFIPPATSPTELTTYIGTPPIKLSLLVVLARLGVYALTLFIRLVDHESGSRRYNNRKDRRHVLAVPSKDTSHSNNSYRQHQIGPQLPIRPARSGSYRTSYRTLDFHIPGNLLLLELDIFFRHLEDTVCRTWQDFVISPKFSGRWQGPSMRLLDQRKHLSSALTGNLFDYLGWNSVVYSKFSIEVLILLPVLLQARRTNWPDL